MSKASNPFLDDPRKSNVTLTHDVRAEVLADLRANVEALPTMQYSFEPWVKRDDVLALLGR